MITNRPAVGAFREIDRELKEIEQQILRLENQKLPTWPRRDIAIMTENALITEMIVGDDDQMYSFIPVTGWLNCNAP
jgi:hypothetical protein